MAMDSRLINFNGLWLLSFETFIFQINSSFTEYDLMILIHSLEKEEHIMSESSKWNCMTIQNCLVYIVLWSLTMLNMLNKWNSWNDLQFCHSLFTQFHPLYQQCIYPWNRLKSVYFQVLTLSVNLKCIKQLQTSTKMIIITILFPTVTSHFCSCSCSYYHFVSQNWLFKFYMFRCTTMMVSNEYEDKKKKKTMRATKI